MASRSFLRASSRPEAYVCPRCTLQASNASGKTIRRWIGTKYLAKMADAEMAWSQKASSIKSGKEKSMLTILEERGLVQTFTGKRVHVDQMMTDRRLGAYVGIDPTASSLHVGHMIPFMALFWMHIHGYHTVSLLGGATAKIGDPTDRLTSREKQHSSVGTANMANMHLQLKKLWKNVEITAAKYGYKSEWAWRRELINNNAWWNTLPMLQFLQLLGPGMRLGSMLARETVKNKMSRGDGMSFAEFTYPLMQAWDWWHMFHTKGIQIQIGGSDQYGNITAGIDAIKYISTHHPNPTVKDEAAAVGEPFGFTVPLLTSSSGQKFGKSAGNAVWLDEEQTSSFELYKYFLGTADADVEKYLQMFTFMPLEDIHALVSEHMKSPEQRKAQHKLAKEFVELVHGKLEAESAEKEHRLLHLKPGAILPPRAEDPSAQIGVSSLNKKPTVNVKLPRHVIFQKSISKILYAVGLATSTSEGRRLIDAGGAYIGSSPNEKHEPMNDGHLSWATIRAWKPEETKKYLIHDDLLLFRRSKKDIRIVQVIPDEEYAMSGLTYPGMLRAWRVGILKAMHVKTTITKEEMENIAKLLEEDESFLDRQAQEGLKGAAKEPLEHDPSLSTPSKVNKSDLPKIDFVKKPKNINDDDPASWIDRL
ncbi:uncharacterized protein LY89DRAFT_508940 [Mollisia scopiformis]|uniref:Tyrosine--tRNA ligase n=1 Tax=Mollisia scopiformis TaxID=149040 RepID=A0A194XGT1_MOLSC|nr:uncharacterized protein LY89DRAFT_508940 [Mollisia scopiformis]KUJ18977.1 hypothetical protein LY89DRAFT_508940 [Mollisia scopiformis]